MGPGDKVWDRVGDLQGWRLVPGLLFTSQHCRHLAGIYGEKRHEKGQEDGEQGC